MKCRNRKGERKRERQRRRETFKERNSRILRKKERKKERDRWNYKGKIDKTEWTFKDGWKYLKNKDCSGMERETWVYLPR